MARWRPALLTDAAGRLDRRYGWDRLPWPLGLLTLIGLRNRLRQKNLYDVGRGPLDRPDVSDHPQYQTARTLDGTFNDLDDPLMGSLGSRFGRNVPLEATIPEPDDRLLEPSPRVVSRELLTRNEFQPATTLNLLAGAWIQFEVHDWFSHGKNEAENPWLVPLDADDPWPEHPMPIERTRRDPSADPGRPPTFVTDDTHWWDGSQIYGREPAFAKAIRTGAHGKLRLDERGLIPQEIEDHVDLTGVAGNFWVGLALLHSLFMREHNAVCDHLHATHPELGDDELFDKARLVVSALMAKIHTVDWTPAIIAHPTTVRGMRANWWGLEGERLDKRIGRLHLERGDPRHPRLADEPPRRPLLTHRGVRRGLPDAPADPGRLQLPLARGRCGAPGAHARGDRGAARPRAADRDVDERRALLVRNLASRARSRCTTFPASCRTSTAPMGRTSIWPRSTSCACASAACRATTSSGGCST